VPGVTVHRPEDVGRLTVLKKAGAGEGESTPAYSVHNDSTILEIDHFIPSTFTKQNLTAKTYILATTIECHFN
jgi:hypothetical protein